MITPRVVRETIEMDDSAPSFDEGMSMIRSERLEDARAIWEVTLRQHRDSRRNMSGLVKARLEISFLEGAESMTLMASTAACA